MFSGKKLLKTSLKTICFVILKGVLKPNIYRLPGHGECGWGVLNLIPNFFHARNRLYVFNLKIIIYKNEGITK